MAHWTANERAAIKSVWSKVNVEEDGAEIVTRLLLVYPWTQRYFSSLGNVSTLSAITGNPKLREHGKRVLGPIGEAVHNLDKKGSMRQLGEFHANRLYDDPKNFRIFGNILILVLATKMGTAFTPQVQHAWEKFINTMTDGLSHN